MSEHRGLRLRASLIYGAIILFALAIAIKLFTIQFVEGERWMARAQHLAMSYRTVQPDRGHIYSEDGRLLSTSVPDYEIRMDMRADGLTDEVIASDLDPLCHALAAMFGDRSAETYRRDLLEARSHNDRYHLVQRHVDHEQVQELKKFPLFDRGRYGSGLIIEKHTVRVHPFGRLAARTVGYVLRDSSAIGLEGGYDGWLRGVTGRRLERRLTGGVWMPVEDGDGQDPVPGSDVHSTVDINLQDVTDAALEKQLRLHGAHHGCVVVMEVATGYVKACSNLTLHGDSIYSEDLNYAVGTSTEPGSTFKTASIMVALEDGRLSPHDKFDTQGGVVKYYGKRMEDSHEGGFGVITLERALEVSSNTAVSQALVKAYGDDPQRFVNGLRRLGLDKPTGVRIPGEPVPTLRGPGDKLWSGLSLPWMSIGYEVSLTPLQLLTFYNAIANEGRMMQPQFVKSITRAGKEVAHFDPVVLDPRICSRSTLEKVRRMLEGVVDSGTASNLHDADYRIAGKTGTAQIAKKGAGYRSAGVSYQASFVGYFPADAPRYSCIVVVSSPTSSGYYGNVVAGPILKEIASKIHANRLDMQTDPARTGPVEQRTPVTFSGNALDLRTALEGLHVPVDQRGEGEWVSTTAADSAVVMVPRSIPGDALHLVPNVLGMGLRDAVYILENRGIRVRVKGVGMVRRQSILPGERYAPGTTIELELTT
ncbi:MAG: transpeptidase family protein [Flavobacteriales bacterium]|nr:transpeptidase family protein [Flavobacteriales bacterium]MCB9193016.1 transpeptidase family protein [Flavobacteriales bacterium]